MINKFVNIGNKAGMGLQTSIFNNHCYQLDWEVGRTEAQRWKSCSKSHSKLIIKPRSNSGLPES